MLTSTVIPPCRQHVQVFPELATGAGIDAGGRLVQEQQLRVVQQAGRERQALLPAPRERSRQLFAPLRETEALERIVDASLAVRQSVDAPDELEVLRDRKILVETESLGHVADLALDSGRLAANVEAQARAASAIGREEPAEHSNGGGLSASVGTKESVDLPAPHLQPESVDDHLVAEALGEALHIDGERASAMGRS